MMISGREVVITANRPYAFTVRKGAIQLATCGMGLGHWIYQRKLLMVCIRLMMKITRTTGATLHAGQRRGRAEEGGTLSCASSADAVAGNGVTSSLARQARGHTASSHRRQRSSVRRLKKP